MAMGVPDASKHEVHALMLVDVSAAAIAKAKANMGKTYITGRITAINDTQLTIMRTDKVSQVIQLDDTTSLHRGGRPFQQPDPGGQPQHPAGQLVHGRLRHPAVTDGGDQVLTVDGDRARHGDVQPPERRPDGRIGKLHQRAGTPAVIGR